MQAAIEKLNRLAAIRNGVAGGSVRIIFLAIPRCLNHEFLWGVTRARVEIVQTRQTRNITVQNDLMSSDSMNLLFFRAEFRGKTW